MKQSALKVVVLLGCCTAARATPVEAPRWIVDLENPARVAQPDALVEIDGAGRDLAGTHWSATVDGVPVPTQAVDRDGDGHPDALALSLSFAPGQRRHVSLSPAAAGTPPIASRVQAMIGVRRGATFNGTKWIGGKLEDVDRLDLPSSHVAGDKLTLYDGPAWESDRIGLRVYLDERNAIDLFGKKQPAPVLQWIGRGIGDYHKEADWGMDILHVTDSLGAGGIGVIEAGHVRQVGRADGGVIGRVIANGPVVAGVAVDDRGLSAGGKRYDLHARYTIAAGSRMTRVDASAPAGAPMVAGIEKRPGVAVLRPARAASGWSYIATYGNQSFIGDGLGIAILFRGADVLDVGDDGHTVYIRFKDPQRMHYRVAVAWAKEGGGIADQERFVSYLNAAIETSAASLRVVPPNRSF